MLCLKEMYLKHREITKTNKVQVYYHQRKQGDAKKKKNLLEKNSDIT